MKWFRFYSEFMEDPKIAMMSDSDQLLWVKLLCLANEGSERGFIKLNDEEICWKLRIQLETLRHAIDKFRAKGMVDHNPEGLQITNWDKRQFKSDNSTERVQKTRKRASRKRKPPKDSSPETLHETFQKHPRNVSCNNIETPPDTDPDQIQNRSRSDSEQKEMRNSKFRRSLSAENLNLESVEPQNSTSEPLETPATRKSPPDNPSPIAVDPSSAATDAIFQKCWLLYGKLRNDTMRDTAGRRQDAIYQWRSRQYDLHEAQAFLNDLQGFDKFKRGQFASTGVALSLPKFETYIAENRIEDYRGYLQEHQGLEPPTQDEIEELYQQRLAAAKAAELEDKKTAYIPPPPNFEDNRVTNFFAAERASL